MTTAEIEEPRLVSASRLAGMNQRRSRLSRLSDSINLEYYWNRDGWVASADGHETEQGHRLIDVKGWRQIPRSPRPVHNEEHNNPFHALLRRPEGPGYFPVEQIVTYGWHRKSPVVFTCRLPLDDYDHPQHIEECFTRIIFPQLEGEPFYEAGCPMCNKVVAGVGSQQQVESLIKKHMEVAHKDHLVNKELVTGLRDALAPLVTGGSSGGMTPEAIAQIAASAALAALQQVMGTGVVTPNPEPTHFVGDDGPEVEPPEEEKKPAKAK